MRLQLLTTSFDLRLQRDLRGRPLLTFGPELPPAPAPDGRPDWQQASPRRIDEAFARVEALPSGGWYVIDDVRSVGEGPRGYQVDDRELVAWRGADGALQVAPGACPHMGAPLAGGALGDDGRLVCPWHGLTLGDRRHGRHELLECFDDGLLLWVRLGEADSGEVALPDLSHRPPSLALAAVLRQEVRCAPEDVIRNRLDPWHGAHFHPHTFAHLRVLEDDGDRLVVRVAFRALGPIAFEVDASFHCPDPRTIVMTVLEGEGSGTIVETHATPIAPGRTAVVEATVASSEREGFRYAERLAPLLRPLLRAAARRLWREDAAYAERTYALREAGAGVDR